MSTLPRPSRTAATPSHRNWLRNVFLRPLCWSGRTADTDDDGVGRRVVVTHLHANDTDPPVLVVEVSDAPMSDEITEEAGRYAAAGIRDYWVIEVGARKLHTFRDPRLDSDAKHGGRYAQVRAHSPYALVSPVAAEIHLAQVINLLPW